MSSGALWMDRPEAVEAFVEGEKVATAAGGVLGDIIRRRPYRSNAGCMLACIRVRGTNGAMYSGRMGAAGRLVKLRKMKGPVR